MNPVDEIINKVRDLTVSKQTELICKLFQISLTDEPSNHVDERIVMPDNNIQDQEIQVKEEKSSQNFMEIQIVKEELVSQNIPVVGIKLEEAPASQRKRKYSKYSEDIKKEAVKIALEKGNNRYKVCHKIILIIL